jgi:predicted acylesterase/phospholipase RssA
LNTRIESQIAKERSRLQELPADRTAFWAEHDRRIGVVLSGGGARGAYEAGVLLAFGHAQLPTHVISAASIGSINAASYAANSEGMVGNAENLVDSWSDLTPAVVGIEWFRYIFVLTGLIAASAGFGNLLLAWIKEHHVVFVHTEHPSLAWLALGIAGTSVLFFHHELSYLSYVIGHRVKHHRWKPDPLKLKQSLIANVLVWGCVFLFLAIAHVHLFALDLLDEDSRPTTFILIGIFAVCGILGVIFRERLSRFSRTFIRLPLRSGLFANYERTRFLRSRIPIDKLKTSPIQVIFAATDVQSGVERFFSNQPREQLAHDPRIERQFVQSEIEDVRDTMMAVIASSAFSIVYETVPLGDHLYTDGGIVANQPIRPAVRMGAEVVFLVMVEPRNQAHHEVKTFLDVGIRALDILMSQNLKADLKTLSTINRQCEYHASKLNVRPEQLVMKNGYRAFSYLKTIVIAPEEDIAATPLDFDGDVTAPAIVQGYRDGITAVLDFAEYLKTLPADLPRIAVELTATPASFAAKS